MSYPLNDDPVVIYYTLFGGFSQLVIDGGSKADGGKSLLGAVFHFDEIFGTKDFFELSATEVRDGKDFFGLEAGLLENIFDILWVVVVEAVFADFFVVGDFFVPRVDFGAAGEEASHFGEGFLVRDFDDGDATGLEDAV